MQYAEDGVTKLITHHEIPWPSQALNIDKHVMEQNYHDDNYTALIKDWYKITDYLIWKFHIGSYYQDDYRQTAVIHMFNKLHLYSPSRGSKLYSYCWRILSSKILDCVRKRDLHEQILKKQYIEITPLEEDTEIPIGNSMIYFENNIKQIKGLTPDNLLLTIDEDRLRCIKIIDSLETILKNKKIYNKKNPYTATITKTAIKCKRILIMYDYTINELKRLNKNPHLNRHIDIINYCKKNLNEWINEANSLIQELNE
jgi:DNA-directed RNA polymerase specialized sigma subunit